MNFKVLIVLLLFAELASATDWYNTTFAYRRQVNITSEAASSGSVWILQVNLSQTMIDGKIDALGDCARLTKADGTTLLYMENKYVNLTTMNATYLVLNDTMVAGVNIHYLYYSNLTSCPYNESFRINSYNDSGLMKAMWYVNDTPITTNPDHPTYANNYTVWGVNASLNGGIGYAGQFNTKSYMMSRSGDRFNNLKKGTIIVRFLSKTVGKEVVFRGVLSKYDVQVYHHTDGTLYFTLDNSATYIKSTGILSATSWYTAGLEWNGTNYTMYMGGGLNNTAKANGVAMLDNKTLEVSFGTLYGYQAQNMTGNVSFGLFFNRTLNASEHRLFVSNATLSATEEEGAITPSPPMFIVNTTMPVNNTYYIYGANVSFNFSIIGNASSYTANYTFDGVGADLGSKNNDTGIITNIGIVGIGQHNLTGCGIYGTAPNQITNCSTINFSIIQYVQWCNLTLAGAESNRTITYETTNTATGSQSNGTNGILQRDGTTIADPDTNQLYGVGTYMFNYSSGDTQNFTGCNKTWYLIVNKKAPNLSMFTSPTATTYGTPINNTGSGCPSQLTCITWWMDDTAGGNYSITNGGNGTYPYGLHYFNYTTVGNSNYTSASSGNEMATVDRYTQWCNVSLEGIELNRTITYETTNTAVGSSSNVTGTFYRDADVIATPDNAQVYGNGTYKFNYTSLGNYNYSSCTKAWWLKVNKYATNLGITALPSALETYPTQTTVTGTDCPAQLVPCSFSRDGVAVPNPEIAILGAQVWIYEYQTTGNTNYTADLASLYFEILQNTTYDLLVTITPSDTVTYGTSTTATGSKCPILGGPSCKLKRGGVDVTNPEIGVFGGGLWLYQYTTVGNTNYSAKNSPLVTLTVNRYTQWCNVSINGTDGNLTVGEGNETNATGTSSNGTAGGVLYINSTVSANPDIAIHLNSTYNYTYYAPETTNYTTCSDTNFLWVNKIEEVTIINITWVFPTNPNWTVNNTNWVYGNVTYNGSMPTYQTLIVDFINETITCDAYTCYRNRTALLKGWHSFQVYLSNGVGENWSDVRYFYVNVSSNATTKKAISIIIPDEEMASLDTSVYMMGGLMLSCAAFILYKRRKKDDPSEEYLAPPE